MAIMTIPRPLHIVMDDLGWFCARDERSSGGPSRTGVTRKHSYKDYLAVNELGKRLGMKITCAFVVGEWDDDNRLKDIKSLSKYGENWDNAHYFDKDEMKRCVDAINGSDYIDFAIHGLLHGYYAEGVDNTDESDYYYKINKKQYTVPEDEIRRRLTAFLDVVRHHGITKKINTFVPPSFTYKWDDVSEILKDYGIDYVSTIFDKMEFDGRKPSSVGIEKCGIVNVDRNNNCVQWNEYFSNLHKHGEKTGVFGVHWPNALHEDADRSIEVVDEWVKYFEKCSQKFGIILSKDIKFCASQLMFAEYAKITEDRGITIVDISDVPKTELTDFEFYISSKEPLESFVGCTFEDYEQKDGFWTYKIKPLTNIMRFDNV